jgi:hypothetical protein
MHGCGLTYVSLLLASLQYPSPSTSQHGVASHESDSAFVGLQQQQQQAAREAAQWAACCWWLTPGRCTWQTSALLPAWPHPAASQKQDQK